MKKICFILLLAIFSVPSVYALSFAPGTMHLDASTQEECEQKGGNFLDRHGSISCTLSPQDVLSSQEIEQIQKLGQQIVEKIGDKKQLHKKLIDFLYTYKQKFVAENNRVKQSIVHVLIMYLENNIPGDKQVNSYETCEQAGGIIMESYPPKCEYNGAIFTQEIALIEIFEGEIVDVISGKDGYQLTIEGVRGYKDSSISAILSIPNLGSHTELDFNDVEVGSQIHVSGESYMMNGVKHITATDAYIQYSKNKATECKERGGEYGNFGGIAGVYMCNEKTPDAGKSCSDVSECQGLCMAETRSCSEQTAIFGCNHVLVENAVEVICID